MPHLLSRWTTGLARRSPFVVGAALVVALAACGSDSATSPSSSGSPSSPVGSYTMSTVNGKAVPTSLYADGSFTYDVTGGTIKLTSDGRFVTVTNTRQSLPGSVENFVDTLGGKWSQSGSGIQMVLDDSTTASATWDKTSITVTSSTGGLALAIVYGNKK